jgi:stringent starvation protein B
VQDGKIVLNLSWTATAQLQIGSDEISFSGRFGGASMLVLVPLGAVLAIYARETGQGMIFTDEPEAPPPGGDAPDPGSREPAAKPAAGRAKLKVVK